MMFHSKIVMVMVGIGLITVLVGGVLRITNPSQSSTPVADSGQTNASDQDARTSVLAMTPSPLSQSAPMPSPTVPVLIIPKDNVVWHDSFDDLGSGWQPKYEVQQAFYGMSMAEPVNDVRLHAWNGYKDSSYQVYLPGLPILRGETATMLWDFNASNPLPTYPYRVRADITVKPAGNAMLLLDYSGDYVSIERGEGVAVVWGHSDGLSYKYVDVWELVVYEFRNGRTWQLGCTSGNLTEYEASQSVAVIDVEENNIRVRLYASDKLVHEAACSRVSTRNADRTRYLGLGAVYPRTLVPASAYNTVGFDDLYVMSGLDNASMPSATPPEEVVGVCVPAWMGWYEDGGPIDVVEALESRTDCRNGYANRSSDFPGYGPKRAVMPGDHDLAGDWFCGDWDGALVTRFYIGQNTEGISDWDLFIDDLSLYVYYSETGDYIVTPSTSGGNNTTFQAVDYVRVGDGIGVLDQHRFTFQFDGNRILTNWTTLPCERQQ